MSPELRAVLANPKGRPGHYPQPLVDVMNAAKDAAQADGTLLLASALDRLHAAGLALVEHYRRSGR